MVPGSEDQGITTDRTISTEATVIETQRSEPTENSTVEIEGDLKTVSSINKAAEYSSVGTVRNNDNPQSNRSGKDKERAALRQHIQSKRVNS